MDGGRAGPPCWPSILVKMNVVENIVSHGASFVHSAWIASRERAWEASVQSTVERRHQLVQGSDVVPSTVEPKQAGRPSADLAERLRRGLPDAALKNRTCVGWGRGTGASDMSALSSSVSALSTDSC